MEKHIKQATANVLVGSAAYALTVWKDERGMYGYEMSGAEGLISSGYLNGELVQTRPAALKETLGEAKSAAESSLRTYLKKPDLKAVWKDLV